MPKTKKSSAKRASPPVEETGAQIAKSFSDIELLAAADVIEAAISSGRKHVDVDALRRVLSKLTAAYQSKSKTERRG